MKFWKWLLVLFFSYVGMRFLYGVAAYIPMKIQNAYAAGVFSLIGCGSLYAVYSRCTAVIEKRVAYELEFSSFFSDTMKGALLGGGVMAISILAMWMMGVYLIGSIAPRWDGVLHGLFFYIVVAVGEELIFRALIFRMMEERWGTTVALVLSCLIFGFAHYTNPGGSVWSSIAIAMTATEAGAFVYSRKLWMPIGVHWAWNFVQGHVFGVPVSGNGIAASVIQSTRPGPDWLTGGAFGAEASIITVTFATSVAAWLIWRAYKKGYYLPFRYQKQPNNQTPGWQS